MTSNHDIHIARFGNRNGAHDILDNTGAPRHLIDSIKWFTDRPGARWDVALNRTHSGYSSEEHYVVQTTVPDFRARRSGMVRTTALLIPHQHLSGIDLGRALDMADVLVDIDPLRRINTTSLEPSGPCPHAPGVAALADTLASTGRAVWVGPGYRDALTCLWRHLSEDDRRRLAFAATDHPGVTALPHSNDGLRVLVAPDPLPAPFADTPTIRTSSVTDLGLSAALLEPDGHPASTLASELGMRRPTLRQWLYLLKVERELRAIHNGSPEHAFAVLALLGLLAPDPAAGEHLKRKVLASLRNMLRGQPYTTVRSLRTVPWETLPESDGHAALTAIWVHHAAAHQDAPSIADAFEDLQRRGSSWFPELHQELISVIAADWRLAAATTAELFQRGEGRAAASTVLRHTLLDSPAAFDLALSDTFRRALAVGSVAAAWAADEALHRRWSITHAVVVDITDPTAAWRMHLRLATNTSAEIVVGRIAPGSTVAAALDIAHPMLLEQAGRLVATDPSLLSPPRPSERTYRQVWTAAVGHGMTVSACCTSAEAAPALLDALLRGDEVDDVLLGYVGDQAGPLLTTHPMRNALWNLRSTTVIEGLRAEVAAYVARQIKTGDSPPERELAHAILAESTLKSLARERPVQAVTVLEVLGGMAQDQHAQIVVRNATKTAPDAARRLGALVRSRRWHGTARRLAMSGRTDLQPAARQASDILGILDRLLGWRVGGGMIPELSTEEVSAALVELLSDVYPTGPPTDLWERAGGRAADLPIAETGRLTWIAALRLVEVGSSGAPSLANLLDAAQHDYPRNENLATLRDHTVRSRTWRKK